MRLDMNVDSEALREECMQQRRPVDPPDPTCQVAVEGGGKGCGPWVFLILGLALIIAGCEVIKAQLDFRKFQIESIKSNLDDSEQSLERIEQHLRK